MYDYLVRRVKARHNKHVFYLYQTDFKAAGETEESKPTLIGKFAPSQTPVVQKVLTDIITDRFTKAKAVRGYSTEKPLTAQEKRTAIRQTLEQDSVTLSEQEGVMLHLIYLALKRVTGYHMMTTLVYYLETKSVEEHRYWLGLCTGNCKAPAALRLLSQG
jgi:hypothetical protein